MIEVDMGNLRLCWLKIRSGRTGLVLPAEKRR